MSDKNFVHPYIPNSVSEIKNRMMKQIGINDIETLYEDIPKELRIKGKLNLPKPYTAEIDLKRHVSKKLLRNRTCEEYLSFLGAGCWQHYVPAVCDEINQRSEFLTAYGGMPYTNFGRNQAHFEFQSQMGELLEMDVVSVPTYSWGSAAGNAICMASRITNRDEIIIPRTVSPERLETIQTYCSGLSALHHLKIDLIDYNVDTGLMDLEKLERKLSSHTAAVYMENPSYLGLIEPQGNEISQMVHAWNALLIVGVDPISLGVLAPPSAYGADIVVGTAQTLGIHMQCGGGAIGFIASRDEERYIAEYPSYLLSITNTEEEGEFGFGVCRFDRTSYAARDKGKDWVGTAAGLWTITAAVYMSLMGPRGFKQIGSTIVQRTQYAIKLLKEIEGIRIFYPSKVFKEFVVNFDRADKSVTEINKDLLDYHIFGGKDLSKEFPELGNAALYCVTEIHNKEDLHRLKKALKEVIGR